MLSSIFISALLAGPVVAGVIPRQNTVTVKHTVTSVIATSTIIEYAPSGKPAAFSYSPSPSPSPSASAALPLAILNGFAENAAGFGLNPINGLPAAPPQEPSSASSTAPLIFHTYTSSKGAAAPIATNSPKSTKSAAASSSSPTLTRLIQTSSVPAHALPSAYSSLPQAPPQFPSIVISKIPVHETSTVASSSSSSKPTTTSSRLRLRLHRHRPRPRPRPRMTMRSRRIWRPCSRAPRRPPILTRTRLSLRSPRSASRRITPIRTRLKIRLKVSEQREA
jgi:hypothetical protein